MQFKAVGETLNATKIVNDIITKTSVLSKSIAGQKRQTTELRNALKGYSVEATKSALAQTNLNKTQIEGVLSSKGLKDKTLEDATAQILDARSKKVNEEATEDLTKDTLNYKFVVEGLKDSIRNTWKSLTTFLGSPLGLTTIAIAAIGGMTAALYAYSKADEKEQSTPLQRGGVGFRPPKFMYLLYNPYPLKI